MKTRSFRSGHVQVQRLLDVGIVVALAVLGVLLVAAHTELDIVVNGFVRRILGCWR